MTNHLRRAALVAVAAAIGCTPASRAFAQDAKQQSAVITLDETMKVPGKTLEAGAYLFQLADNDSVKIIRAKDNKVMTTAKVMRVDHPPQDVGVAITVARADTNDEFPTMKGFTYPGSGGSYQFVFSSAIAHKLEHADTTEIPIAPPQS